MRHSYIISCDCEKIVSASGVGMGDTDIAGLSVVTGQPAYRGEKCTCFDTETREKVKVDKVLFHKATYFNEDGEEVSYYDRV